MLFRPCSFLQLFYWHRSISYRHYTQDSFSESGQQIFVLCLMLAMILLPCNGERNDFSAAVWILRNSVLLLIPWKGKRHRERSAHFAYTCRAVCCQSPYVDRWHKVAIEAKGSGFMTTLVRRLILTTSVQLMMAAAAAGAPCGVILSQYQRLARQQLKQPAAILSSGGFGASGDDADERTVASSDGRARNHRREQRDWRTVLANKARFVRDESHFREVDCCYNRQSVREAAAAVGLRGPR